MPPYEVKVWPKRVLGADIRLEVAAWVASAAGVKSVRFKFAKLKIFPELWEDAKSRSLRGVLYSTLE